MTTIPLLRFIDVTKEFGQLRALGPITLDVPAGQLVALIGHNGSGKSTLLATAAGSVAPTSGFVEVSGAAAGSPPARAAISYLRDTPVLYNDISLNEQINYLARLHHSTPAAHDAADIIERLGLASRADDPPGSFSRGLRQKAAIVLALCRPFAVLVIDEPFAGLDAAGQDTLLELLEEIRTQRGSVIVATHDRSKLENFDRHIRLDDGEVTRDEPT